MALFNYATKEITIKIVYYGPGLSGKTTNLQYLHSVLDPKTKGKLLSLATEADRTLFFDFLPVEVGRIRDFSVRFQLYTVPGQVRYDATRKLVLKGADAVVFVADSQRQMIEQNIDSMKNMRENLIENNINPDDIPFVLQYNKRDLSNVLSIEELNKELNENKKYEHEESIAIDGVGVEETFKTITKLAIKGIAKRHKIKVQTPGEFEQMIQAEIPDEKIGAAAIFPEEPVAPVPAVERSPYDIFEVKEPTFEKGAAFEVKEPVFEVKEPSQKVKESAFEVKETAFELKEPAFEATGPSFEVEEPIFEMPEARKEAFQAVVEGEAPLPKEIIIKEIREVPAIPIEKLETIVNGITDLTRTLKEIKDATAKLALEIREMRKEHKDVNVLLRDLKRSFESIQTKKSWFRFS